MIFAASTFVRISSKLSLSGNRGPVGHGQADRTVFHQSTKGEWKCSSSTTSLRKSPLSGLVPTADLTQARAQVEPEPAADAALRLARLLVQQGLLTTYQARKLLAGATRGFFLGGYRILSPLGEGGMGKVFLAVNEQTFGKVAIKVLPPRKAIEEAGSLVRFRREMELSQRRDHPNVARTLAVGTEGDVNFIVLEYIPGMSLFDMVRSERYGPLRVSDAARLFLKVLDGLDAAHQAGPGASRHQAFEHHDHARWQRQDSRSWPGPRHG